MNQDLRIFISYSKTESSRIANDLYLHLRERLGYYVFLDKEEISGGEGWKDKIVKEIEDCDIFIILITPGAIKSKFINDVEIPQAKKRSSKRYLHIIQCLHIESVSEKDAKKWNLSDKQMIYYKDLELESLRNSINKSIQGYKENSEDYAKIEKTRATRKKIKIASIPVAGFF